MFSGQPYVHRNQGIGNSIAVYLYEDLFELGRSKRFVEYVTSNRSVVSTRDRIVGRRGRRGDGTFGALIPGERPVFKQGFAVRRGPIGALEIGAEVKIIAKSMLKQIDRVINDLTGQARTFEIQAPNAIRVAMVGVNFSDAYTGYEKDRAFPTKTPPSREAPKVIPRVEEHLGAKYDELLIFRFKATNTAPFPFAWVDADEMHQTYGAALLRISRLFDTRF